MDLIRDFKDPGREYSVLAFWFLNGELKKERLAWQIGQMVEKRVFQGKAVSWLICRPICLIVAL